IIHTVLDKKIPKSEIIEEEEIIISNKALFYSNIAFLVMILIVIYMIIPGLGSSGILLGDGNSYIEQLLGNTSPFYMGFTFILLGITMVCGFIYGYLSGNIKNSNEYSVALSKNFEGLGYLFVLLFFTSQMLGIIEWSNLGTVIAAKFVSVLSTLSFTGIPLIITFFVVIVLISILLPSISAKWTIVAPLSVPLLMRANVTPSFAQFMFRAADGVGKSFSPLFVYFIIMLAILEKYNTKENNKITVFGILKTILPTVLLFAGLWLLIILCWYLIGIPTGPGVYSTF
ncbi:MAG TPA: AbgT family transporter, partial [Bacilli bacterium]|nr:AbgT family transporter [Bacilli bacterium]